MKHCTSSTTACNQPMKQVHTITTLNLLTKRGCWKCDKIWHKKIQHSITALQNVRHKIVVPFRRTRKSKKWKCSTPSLGWKMRDVKLQTAYGKPLFGKHQDLHTCSTRMFEYILVSNARTCISGMHSSAGFYIIGGKTRWVLTVIVPTFCWNCQADNCEKM